MNKLNIWNYQKLIQPRNRLLQGRLSCHGQNIWFLSFLASWEKIPCVVHRSPRFTRVMIYNMKLVLTDLQIIKIKDITNKVNRKKVICFQSGGWLEFLISGWPNFFNQFLNISYVSVIHLKTSMLPCFWF